MNAKQIIQDLKHALKAARFENCEFGVMWDGCALPTKESEVTEFIRERTRLYRESWITSYIELALEQLEEKETPIAEGAKS